MSVSDKDKHTALGDLSEPELIEQVKAGSVKAFDELVGRYSLFVMKQSLGLARDETVAEELFQNVFITVYYKIHTFKGESAFATWLSTVISNEWRMYLRQIVKKHIIPKEEEELDRMEHTEKDDLDETLEFREISGKIHEAIKELPDHYAAVIRKFAIEGKSYESVASELKLTRSQVKSRLFRARKMLEKILEEYFNE